MAKYLPLAQPSPVRFTAIGIGALAIGKPVLGIPVPAANIALGACELQANDGNGGHDDSGDAGELEDDKVRVELGAGLGADGVCNAHDQQDKDGEELVRQLAGAIHYTGGRVGALDEYDAEDGQGGRHNGDDPRPGREEAVDIAIDVPKVRLDAPCRCVSARVCARTRDTRLQDSQLTFSRNCSAELGKGARARPREDAADEPDDQRDARRWHVGVDGPRRREDAAADDDADDDGEGFDGSEVSRKGALLEARGFVVGCALVQEERLVRGGVVGAVGSHCR